MADMTYIKLFVDYLDEIEPLGDAERGEAFHFLVRIRKDGRSPAAWRERTVSFPYDEGADRQGQAKIQARRKPPKLERRDNTGKPERTR